MVKARQGQTLLLITNIGKLET